MNTTRWMLSQSLVLGLCVSTAAAQDAYQARMWQPGSVRQVAYDYGDYYGDYYANEEAADDTQAAPVPVSSNTYSAATTATTGGCSSCGSCNSCGSCGSCSSCGDCGCGDCGCGSSCEWCNLGDAWELCPATDCQPITIGGWLQGGYHNKPTPLSTTYGELLSFNDVPNHFNAHQMWMYAAKEADGSNGLDWGFRFDGMYGTDAQKTQAFGQPTGWDTQWDNGVYGWAIPQAYVELAAGDLSVIAGHFFTLVGYEVVPATGNFFYSHALTMFNSEPFTHTGVLATYTASDSVTLYGGWTAGWDTGFTQYQDGSMFLGGAGLTLTDDLTFTYILYAGNLGWRGDDGYGHSMVLNANVTDKWNYVLQSDYVRSDQTQDDDISINQYLFYTVNDCLAVGGRMEWWQDDGESHYECTGGVNLRAHANFIVRPEIRHDWNPHNNFDQTTFGIDGILTF
ncbi:MAG: outer membrane beta-barrel protein [Pirellulales bacterium]|nr:porin [Planctomycetales bacterium]